MIVNDGNKKLCSRVFEALSEMRAVGIYQTEMAKSIGIHRQYVSMMFRRRFDKVPMKAMELMLVYFKIDYTIVRDSSGLLTVGDSCL